MKVLILAALVAAPAFAEDYALSSEDGLMYEVQSTSKGMINKGTLDPGVYDGGCDFNAVSAALIAPVNTSIAYAVFEPCEALTVVIEYNYGAQGFYEKGRFSVPLVGPFDREPYVSSVTTGPDQSLSLFVTDVDLAPQNSVLLYNNRFQLLENLTFNYAKITKAFIDDGGMLFYVCVKPGEGGIPSLYVYQFQSKGSVLHTSQPVLPVPYKAIGIYDPQTYENRTLIREFCGPQSPAL